jgi:phosphatidylserine/phosphatidylglycerophosphate/cardiolipin synthase-like enzyme
MIQYLQDREIYTEVICGCIPRAQQYVWIATADIKDMYVRTGRKQMEPFLGVIARLIQRGIGVRLIHAKEPGPRFRNDFDRYPQLCTALERMLCRRMHSKLVVVDGTLCYCGSANLTGAGMGAKSDHKRNFESGILTDDQSLTDAITQQFDQLWMGQSCTGCYYKNVCADFRDLFG